MINEIFNTFIGQIGEIFGSEFAFTVGQSMSFGLIGIIAIIFKFLNF